MTDPLAVSPPQQTLEPSFFHQDSDSVRFWVRVGSEIIGASIGRYVLLHRYNAGKPAEEPLETLRTHLAEIEAAVRRRVAKGSREPVMLREFDLQVQ